MKFFDVPEEQSWRVEVIKDMIELKWNSIEIDAGFQEEDLNTIISQLAIY